MLIDTLDQIPYLDSWVILSGDGVHTVKVVAGYTNEADFLKNLGDMIGSALPGQQFRGFKVTPYIAKLVLQAAPAS